MKNKQSIDIIFAFFFSFQILMNSDIAEMTVVMLPCQGPSQPEG